MNNKSLPYARRGEGRDAGNERPAEVCASFTSCTLQKRDAAQFLVAGHELGRSRACAAMSSG